MPRDRFVLTMSWLVFAVAGLMALVWYQFGPVFAGMVFCTFVIARMMQRT